MTHDSTCDLFLYASLTPLNAPLFHTHTSHIAHHTSHITHHTSHITHHTSPITHHTSPITHHSQPSNESPALSIAPISSLPTDESHVSFPSYISRNFLITYFRIFLLLIFLFSYYLFSYFLFFFFSYFLIFLLLPCCHSFHAHTHIITTLHQHCPLTFPPFSSGACEVSHVFHFGTRSC